MNSILFKFKLFNEKKLQSFKLSKPLVVVAVVIKKIIITSRKLERNQIAAGGEREGGDRDRKREKKEWGEIGRW